MTAVFPPLGRTGFVFWCRRDCRALANNLLDSGHVPCEVGLGLFGVPKLCLLLKIKVFDKELPTEVL